jgi:signal transduction histidine kinase
VQALRTSVTEMNNLASAIRAYADELQAHEGNAEVDVRVDVQGPARALHPLVRDEVFRIAGEALRNALRHAGASQIEVEVAYGPHQFRLRVRDDGKGIDPQVVDVQARRRPLRACRHARARGGVGGKLTVWSALYAGTEIELTVPAANAYVGAAKDAPVFELRDDRAEAR